MDEIKLLLVEDNEYDQMAFRRMAKQRELPYRIVSATSGAAALSELDGSRFDIILLDFLLIDMDGLEFLKEINKRGVDTPVVFLTGQGSEKVAVSAMKLGAYDYLTKTSDMSHLSQLPGTITQAIDQHRLKKEREEIERMRTDFIAMLTHDLKNPLSTIISAVEFLSQGGEMEESQKRMVTLVEGASKDMLGLVENFLMVSKIESGKLEQSTEPVNLSEVLTRVYNMNRLQAENEDIDFKLELAEDLPLFECNPTQMFRAVTNLVGNALKFTPSGKKVVLGEEFDGSRINIYVKDQGPGIDPDILPFIFDKYKRSSSDENPKGIGLGLFIVKNIAEAVGGRVKVQSQVGKGTTFNIYLPVAEESVHQSEP